MGERAVITYTITGTSPAAPGSAVVGSAVDLSLLPGGSGNGLDVIDDIDVIAATHGATGGVLDLVLQTSPDGVTYTDWMHFTQIAAAAGNAFQRAMSSHDAQQNPVAVGQGTTTALAATTTAGGPQRFIRLVAVAGASTTAGATQTITLMAKGSRARSS